MPLSHARLLSRCGFLVRSQIHRLSVRKHFPCKDEKGHQRVSGKRRPALELPSGKIRTQGGFQNPAAFLRSPLTTKANFRYTHETGLLPSRVVLLFQGSLARRTLPCFSCRAFRHVVWLASPQSQG